MTDAGEHDRRAGLMVWAQQARVRSAACRAQAAAAASSASVRREQADRLIERAAERNPKYAERLLAISATADGRRAAIAEQKHSLAAGRVGGPPLIRPREPQAAIIAELDAHLSEMAIVGERDRIAGELRDRVIQRVFTAGLALDSAAGLTTQREVRSRIEAASGGLDEVIRIIRDAIFGPADQPLPASLAVARTPQARRQPRPEEHLCIEPGHGPLMHPAHSP